MLSGAAVGLGFGLAATTWLPATLMQLGARAGPAGVAWVAVVAIVFGLRFAAMAAVAAPLARLGPRAFLIAWPMAVFAIEALWSLPPSIGWGLIGHTQIETPLRAFAVLGGVPLVSAVTCALAAAIALLGHGTRRTALIAIFAIVLGVVGLTIGGASQERREMRTTDAKSILLVQPNIPIGERWAPETQRTNLARALEVTRRALAASRDKVHLIVWPETILTAFLEESPDLNADLRLALSSLGAPVVMGLARSPLHGSGYRNSAAWFNERQQLIASIDKTVLAPFGEVPLWPIDSPGTWAEPGSTEQPLRGSFELSPSLCLEVLYPSVVRARTRESTLALVNLANDGWFADAVVSADQLQVARFRAIEHRLWLLRVADGGVSASVDPFGSVRASLSPSAGGWILAHVPARGGFRPGEKFVLWAWALSGTLVGGLIATITRRLVT
jgi:apolipoprotein N-acyltransferase